MASGSRWNPGAALSRAPALEGYLPALLALSIAIAIHFLFHITIGVRLSGIFFIYLSSLLIAAWCGYGPGLLILFLGMFILPYWYRPGFSAFRLDPGGVSTMVVVSLLTSFIAERRRRTERVLRHRNIELDRSVREKTAELERANRTLRYRLAELESLYRKVPVGLCFLDSELRFVRINEQLALIHGRTVSDHLGSRIRDIIPDELAAILEPIYRRVLETGERLASHELCGPSPLDGSKRYWLISCSPVIAEDGSVLGLQIIFQDITERKRTELELARSNAALKQTNKALARVNEDLGQFAYIAAHDLQEPLRTVVTFSQLLERKWAGVTDAATREHLKFIVGSARRMSVLIADVLAYSQTSLEAKSTPQVIDLNETVAGVLVSLQAGISESGAKVVAHSLPQVPGDGVQLGQVFYNLIGNALKYGKPGVAPQVEIGARDGNGEWTIFVTDNGQGFRQEYAERIFGIFRRLHGMDVPGSGIGLAICKRVVERHGGRIWAESQEGCGASFFFTLPAAENSHGNGPEDLPNQTAALGGTQGKTR